MASGTADLQRDLGGAIMQSVLGALLTAGYAQRVRLGHRQLRRGDRVTPEVQSELTKSFAGAEQVAQQYPKYADQITAAAKSSFLQGDDWAYGAGVIAILLGAISSSCVSPARKQNGRACATTQPRTRAPACRPSRPPTHDAGADRGSCGHPHSPQMAR